MGEGLLGGADDLSLLNRSADVSSAGWGWVHGRWKTGSVSVLRFWHRCIVVLHRSALTFQRVEAVDEDQVFAVGLADRAGETAA